jgi:hypothetical protein
LLRFARNDESARGLRLRALIGRLVGDSRFGEGRHAGVAGERGAENQQRRGGAGGFAEPHVEIEQRLQVQLVEQRAVASLGGDVAGKGMGERIGAQLVERGDGSGADKAVEQHRDVVAARGKRGA